MRRARGREATSWSDFHSACLIDEATQATEPATIIPLTKGCKQVVLIGDQNQLPPTIIVVTPKRRVLGKAFSCVSFDQASRVHVEGTVSYAPAIALFPSQTFYKGELLSGTPPNQRARRSVSTGRCPLPLLHPSALKGEAAPAALRKPTPPKFNAW